MTNSNSSSSSLKRLAFGQLLSCLQAASGVINALLKERKGVNVPILQAALTYSLLAVLFWRHRGVPIESALRRPLLGAVVFDVVASWMIVAAFDGLQLGQVILLLGLSTPSSMLFNHFWNPRPYTWSQLSGIGVALACIAVYWGGGMWTLSGASKLYLLLGAGAAVSYAASNNFQEFTCTRLSSGQFLFWLGAGGSVLSCASLFLFNPREFSAAVVDWLVVGLVGAYVLVLASFYALIPVYLRGWGSAVSFNLSLLSANLIGAVGEGWMVQGNERVSWELMTAIGGLSAGLIIFYVNDPNDEVKNESEEENRISDIKHCK